MTQVGDLLRLQSLDTELATVAAGISGLEARLEGDADLAAARERVAALTADLEAAQREQRRLEAQVEDLTARIEPEERRLYGGSVRSPKELSGIQHEVELLKARRASIEEALIGMMDRVEAAQRELETARAHEAVRGDRWEMESRALQADRERLRSRKQALEQALAGQREAVPPTALGLYDDLRRRKAGLAVVPVVGGACTGCRVMLPDAVRRRAVTSALPVHCPNCERILSAAG